MPITPFKLKLENKLVVVLKCTCPGLQIRLNRMSAISFRETFFDAKNKMDAAEKKLKNDPTMKKQEYVKT